MELNIDQVYFGNYIPLPGTKDFNILIENNEISLEDIDWNNYSAFYGSIPYHPKNISSDELLILIRKATKRFYFRPKIFLKFLCRTTRPVFIKSSLFRLFSLFFNK